MPAYGLRLTAYGLRLTAYGLRRIPGQQRAVVAHRLLGGAEHGDALARAAVGEALEDRPVAEHRLHVEAGLAEGHALHEEVELLRGVGQPAVDAARAGVVGGRRGQAVAAVAVEHVADIGAAQADVQLRVEHRVGARIADAELAGQLGGGAGHHLHQAPGAGGGDRLGVVGALAPGDAHQQVGVDPRHAPPVQEVLAIGLGEAPLQGIPHAPGDGGLYQLGVPAAALGVVGQGAGLPLVGTLYGRIPFAGGKPRFVDAQQRLGALHGRPARHLLAEAVVEAAALQVGGVGLAQAVGGGEAEEAAPLGGQGIGLPGPGVVAEPLVGAAGPVVPAAVIPGVGLHARQPVQHAAPVAVGQGGTHAQLEQVRVAAGGQGLVHPATVVADVAH